MGGVSVNPLSTMLLTKNIYYLLLSSAIAAGLVRELNDYN